MRDKLTKTGKTKRYYQVRKLLVFVALLGCLGACIAVPVSIKLHHKPNNALVVR